MPESTATAAQPLDELRLPDVFLDPPLPTPTEYESVDAARAAVLGHYGGNFHAGALLAERMLWNARLWSVAQTRVNGLIATKVRWRASRENRDGRRALAAWREDYPRMVPAATRKVRAYDGLLLGVGFAQRRAVFNPNARRWLLHLDPYWAGHVTWLQSLRRYRVRTYGTAAYEEVASPAMGGTINPRVTPWYVYEPNGPYSWRRGLLVPLWFTWFILDRTIRDGARFAEKHGVGILKAYFPDSEGSNQNREGAGPEARDSERKFVRNLRSMGGEGIIPLRRGATKDEAEQDVVPLEFTGGAGFAGIEAMRNAGNVDASTAVLGHNLTTEVKGGAFAAANVGDLIRSDLKESDALGEIAADVEQLGRAWAELNFGDPDLAPLGVAETDPPAADQTAAATLQSLAQALQSMPDDVRRIIDVEALLDRFAVALRVERPRPPQEVVPQATPTPSQPARDSGDSGDSPQQGS